MVDSQSGICTCTSNHQHQRGKPQSVHLSHLLVQQRHVQAGGGSISCGQRAMVAARQPQQQQRSHMQRTPTNPEYRQCNKTCRSNILQHVALLLHCVSAAAQSESLPRQPAGTHAHPAQALAPQLKQEHAVVLPACARHSCMPCDSSWRRCCAYDSWPQSAMTIFLEVRPLPLP